jgi:hypothetical protein
MMEQKITIGRPPEVTAAVAALDSLLRLEVGDIAYFDPPLEKAVVDSLFRLLLAVNRGWRITTGPEPKLGWWASLRRSMNYPVDIFGHAVPQTIKEVERTR